ncbi:hypothetical protein L249_3730, partial [Ophiocordyceps polyrhachis-furcata BCC 54312]
MSDPNSYSIGWISALELEYAAAQEFFDDEHEPPTYIHRHDDNHYALGRIGRHNVAMAVLPTGEHGIAAAARAAKDMRHTFPNIRVCLLVGIGGGAPNQGHDIRLGDIVVSTPSFHPESGNHGGVVQYDYARTIQSKRFSSIRFLNSPPVALLSAVAGVRTRHIRKGNTIHAKIEEMLRHRPRMRREYSRPDRDTDRLYASEGETVIPRQPRTEEDDDPAVHYGLIASADNFMESAEIRDILAEELGVLCFEMEAAGLVNSFPCIVIRGICDYADKHWLKPWRGYAAMAAAAYARELVLELVPAQIEAAKSIGQLLDQIDEHLGDLKVATSGTRREIETLRDVVLDNNQKAVLERLPNVPGAAFDSYADEPEPRCLPNTRVELLNQVKSWANNEEAESIFWLNGMAGTGKSTVSRSIADALHQESKLGASFFFRRGEEFRDNPSRLFTTLASQLATRRPIIAPLIKSAIDEDPFLPQKTLAEQFEKLIRQPLLAGLPPGQSKGVILVIDALDECEADNRAQLVLRVFRSYESLGLKLFITSRPEEPVRLGFMASGTKYKDLILQDISQDIIRHDLSLFMQTELERVRKNWNSIAPDTGGLAQDWPGTSQVRYLVNMAMPLFIFAATICRFLAESRCGNPDEQLQEVLRYGALSQESELNKTYRPVLDSLIARLSPRMTDKVLSQFRTIVGSIILLANPLSTRGLSRILRISQGIVDGQLRQLHSVLSVPQSARSPIRLLHLSFRDFLVDADQRGQNPFWIDEEKTHRELGSRCLQLMTEVLVRDICGLEKAGKLDSNVSEHQVDEHISAEAQYACLHWVFHFQGARDSMSGLDLEQIHTFLKLCFLPWVEVLCLMRRVSDGVMMVQDLKHLIQRQLPDVPYHADSHVEDKQSSPRQTLDDFLDDAKRFLRHNRSIIEEAPMQLYSSGLIFTPENSTVRKQFATWLPPFIRVLPTMSTSWSPLLQTFEGRPGTQWRRLAFSPDSRLLAASAWETVRVWDTATGAAVQIIELGVIDSSLSVQLAFSSNRHLVSVTEKYKSKQLNTLAAHWRDMTTGTGVTLDVCDVETDPYTYMDVDFLVTPEKRATTYRPLNCHREWMLSLDGAQLATTIGIGERNNRSSIRLCDTATGEMRELRGHASRIDACAFSPDGRILVSASQDGTIRLWERATGAALEIILLDAATILHKSICWCQMFVFSPENESAGCATHYKYFHCRDVTVSRGLRALFVRPTGDGPLIQPGNISFNGRHLASYEWASAPTFEVWDISTGALKQTFKSPHSFIRALAFSPDVQLIASASDDATVRLWNVGSDQVLRDPTDPARLACKLETLSPDGKTMALTRGSQAIESWDMSNGVSLPTLHGHSDPIRLLAFSPDSERLVSVSHSETRLWDLNSCTYMASLDPSIMHAESVVFSPDGKVALSRCKRSDYAVMRTKVWDWTNCAPFPGFLHYVGASAFSPNGKHIALALLDYRIALWNISAGHIERFLADQLPDLTGFMAFSPDGQLLASASARLCGGTIQLWDPATGVALQTLTGHDDWIAALEFSPDSRKLASCSSRRLKVWDITTGAVIGDFQDDMARRHKFRTEEVIVSFSSDGTVVATDTTLWNVASVLALSLKQDGPMTTNLWDVDTGALLFELDVVLGEDKHYYQFKYQDEMPRIPCAVSSDRRGQFASKTSALAFSPDSQVLASASGDGSVMLWDTKTGTVVLSLEQGDHDQSAILPPIIQVVRSAVSVIFSSDGNSLASLSHNSIRLWDATTGGLIESNSENLDSRIELDVTPDLQSGVAVSSLSFLLSEDLQYSLTEEEDSLSTHAAWSLNQGPFSFAMLEPSIRMRRAIHAGDVLLVRRILKSHPYLLRNPDASLMGLSNSNLHLAASLGHRDVCETLLLADHEKPCPALNEHHQTALMLAARAGHTEVVHLLCEADRSSILRRDIRGRDAVMEASIGGHDTILQLLLTYAPGGPNEAVQRADVEGNTALHFASSNSNFLGLRTLLAAGADVERRNVWSWTPAAYSATVQVEVYLKSLVNEVERRHHQLRRAIDPPSKGAAVRVVPSESTKLIVTQYLESRQDPPAWAWISVGAFLDHDDRIIWSTELFVAILDAQFESDDDDDGSTEEEVDENSYVSDSSSGTYGAPAGGVYVPGASGSFMTQQTFSYQPNGTGNMLPRQAQPWPVIDPSMPAAHMTNSSGGVGCEP